MTTDQTHTPPDLCLCSPVRDSDALYLQQRMQCFSDFDNSDPEFSFLIQIYIYFRCSQHNLVLPWIYQSALCVAAAVAYV